jgi:hypothetical protein
MSESLYPLFLSLQGCGYVVFRWQRNSGGRERRPLNAGARSCMSVPAPWLTKVSELTKRGDNRAEQGRRLWQLCSWMRRVFSLRAEGKTL